MKPLIKYITEALKPISTNALSIWRMKVAKPDYYHEELISNHYIRSLINSLVRKDKTLIERRRKISDFIEMYFGNYISAKDGSSTLAQTKIIEHKEGTHKCMVVAIVTDKWFGGILARFIFKVRINDPEKYFDEKKPEGNATLTINIETPVYKSESDVAWTATRPISIVVPASIPQNDPLYMDLAKQMSAQTRDMNWGFYDPVKNRFSKEN